MKSIATVGNKRRYTLGNVIIVVLVFMAAEQFSYALNVPLTLPWLGESDHISLNFGFGHEFTFIDYAAPFFNSTQAPLLLSNSFTQQYSLLGSQRVKNPLRIGRNNKFKYLEIGFGFNVLHRTNHGEGLQQVQAIHKSDSSQQIVSGTRSIEVSNLSVGISGIVDMPTYIINKLRIRLEPNINMVVWDKTRSVLSLSDNDSSTILPNSTNITYATNRRTATRESGGDRTFGMVYSLKFGISYSIYILLRETPWYHVTEQYGELQPYINYVLSSTPTLSGSHRTISGLQVGVRITIPADVYRLNEADYEGIDW